MKHQCLSQRKFKFIIKEIFIFIFLFYIFSLKYSFLTFVDVFSFHVWASVILLFFSFRSVLYLKDLSSTSGHGSTLGIMAIYGFLVCQPANIITGIKESKFIKYMLMLLLISNVLISTAYNSRLSSIMVAPIYENDIKTLEELAASDLKLLFFDYYYQPLTRDTRVNI